MSTGRSRKGQFEEIEVDDVPWLEFLNERGEVVYRLPPEGLEEGK